MQVMNTLQKLLNRTATIGAAGFLLAFVVALVWPSRAALTQPIRFNHRKHIDAGLQCDTCHERFSKSPFAGLPQLDVCLTCHEQAITQSTEEAKIREFAQRKQPVPWRQVNQLPKHVYFSHQTHASSNQIACTVCHGDMEKATAPPSSPLFAWTMSACLNCHEQQHATQDCNGCHR